MAPAQAKSSSTGGMCSFSGLVYVLRRPAKHHDSAEDIRRQTNFNALIGIVEYLQESEEKVLTTWANLRQGRVRTTPIENEEDKPYWDDSYSKLQKLPKYFLMENLRMWSLNSLTQDMLIKIDKRDASAIRDIHDFATWTSGSMLLPRAALNKEVCKTMLKKCYIRGGELLQDFAEYVGKDGTIDWGRAGAYTLTFNKDDTVKSLVHINGDEYKLTAEDGLFRKSHVNITDPMRHHTAELRQGRSRLVCWECFDKGTGGNRFWNQKGEELSALTQECETEVTEATTKAQKEKAKTEQKVDDQTMPTKNSLKANEKARREDAAKKRVASKPPNEPKGKKKVIKVA